MGSIYLILGHYDKLFALYDKLKTKQLLNIEIARVSHEEGEAFLRCGKREQAKISFANSLDLLIACDNSFDCYFLRGQNNNNLSLLENDPDLVYKYAIEALSSFNALIIISDDREDNWKIQCSIADIHSRIGDFDNAMEPYSIALHLAKYNNEKIWVLYGIASSYYKKGENEQANSYFKKALEFEDDTTETLNIYYDMGVMYFNNNSMQDAKEAFQEALKTKIKDVSLRNNPEYEISIFWHLGVIAYNVYDNENALIYLNKVLDKIDCNHYYYVNTHLTLGHFYYRNEEYEKARNHYNLVIKAPQAYDDEIKSAKNYLSQLPLDG